MPATRSQAQSPSASLQPRHGYAPIRESQLETLDTVSTAIIPPVCSITLATTTRVANEEAIRHHVRGQECLHDAVRKVGDREGDLRDLAQARKRRRIGVDREHEQFPVLSKGVWWYTASLRYPCSCDLEPLRRAFTLRQPPPHPHDLDDSSSLSNLSDAAAYVQLGRYIPEWHVDTNTDSGYVDLEPGLSQLREFEHEWRAATGSISRQSIGYGRFCDAFEEDGVDDGPDPVSFEAVKESLATRRTRKGKYKAVDEINDMPTAPDGSAVISSAFIAATAGSNVVARSDGPISAWEEESRRRKQLWRGLIGKDPGYGQFWEHLPRPHTYSDIRALPDRVRPADYNLFRNYRISSHPFHPDLHHYVRKNPYGRVYWLIPIHGPVIVPALNDWTESSDRAHQAEKDVPIPSSGSFSTETPIEATGKLVRPASLRWTPPLLSHFVQSFLLPLRQSRLFGISLAFSGPKPDPFIALPATPRLTCHVHVPKKTAVTGPQIASDPTPPVRPEAGDHLRIYCDAKEALSLRTWVNGVAVDRSTLDSVNDTTGGQGQARKLFEKVRLCLVGDRGEVLIVA